VQFSSVLKDLLSDASKMGLDVAGSTALGPLWPLFRPTAERLIEKLGPGPTNDQKLEAALRQIETDDHLEAGQIAIARKVVEALDDQNFETLRSLARLSDHAEIAAASRRSRLLNQMSLASALAEPWRVLQGMMVTNMGHTPEERAAKNAAIEEARRETNRLLALLGLSQAAYVHINALLDDRHWMGATNDVMQALKTQIHPLADLAFRLSTLASYKDVESRTQVALKLSDEYGATSAGRRFLAELNEASTDAEREQVIKNMFSYLKVFG
jgi:hypothetical protein